MMKRYSCELADSFAEYRRKTTTLMGKLRREFEYREKHGKPCGSDKHLQEEIEAFIKDVEGE